MIIRHKEYIKEILFVALTAFVKLAYGLIFIKVVSGFLSVSEYGLYGQIISVFSLMIMLPNSFLQNGLVKYLSKYKGNDNNKYIESIQVSSFIVSLLSLIICVLFLVTTSFFSDIVFSIDMNEYLILFIIIMFILSVFGSLQLSILNATKKPKVLFVSNLLSSVIIITLLFVNKWTINDVVILSLSYHVLMMFFILCYNIKKNSFKFNTLKIKHFNWCLLKKMSPFLIIACAGFFSIQLAQIIIRPILAKSSGWDSVGLWQVSLRLSDLSLFFVTLFFTSVLYPSLARLSTNTELRREMYKFIVFVFFPICIVLLFAIEYRGLIVELLFDIKYESAESIIPQTFIGDIFRILSYSFAQIILLKSSFKINVFLQFLQFSIYMILGVLAASNGLYSLSLAYPFAYFIYLWIVLFFVKKYIK